MNDRHIVVATRKDSGVGAVEAEAKNVAQMLLQHHLRRFFVNKTLFDVPKQHTLVISTCRKERLISVSHALLLVVSSSGDFVVNFE